MKVFLKFILLPGLLCASGFFAGYRYRQNAAPVSPPAQNTVVDSQNTEAPVVQENNPQPFQWKQLESTDYRIYISNLRRIGCPEQTIRDIITADVDSVFEKNRQQLIANASGESQRDGLAELRQKENAFLAALLGSQPKDGSNQVAAGVSRARAMLSRSPVSIPALPLVLQNADLTPLKLNAAQLEIVDNLRQKFRDEIGTSQDPSDSAYRERWLKAQHESDDLLRGMLGVNLYLNYRQLIASQQPQAP